MNIMDINRDDEAADLSVVQQARRDFLGKAGKLAVYTPPLMMGLLVPGAHAIASGTRPPTGRRPKDWRRNYNPENREALREALEARREAYREALAARQESREEALRALQARLEAIRGAKGRG